MIDSPRLRLLIGTHGMQLAIVLVGVATLALLMAGWLAFVPATETVTQQAHQQEITTSASTGALVTANDSLWPAGTELHDSPVYLYNATPSMAVTGETVVHGTDSAAISHEWTVTIQAETNEEVFWSESERLVPDTTMQEGAITQTTVTLDAADLRDRVERAERVVGTAGTVSAVLTLSVEYETDRYDGSTTVSTPIELQADAYGLSEELTDQSAHATAVQTEATHPPDHSVVYGLVAFALIAFAGAAGIVYSRPDTIDLDQARTDAYRRQYDEWISPGTIPDGLGQAFLAVESLEDVVDVAIDTNERVIHDARRDVYAVISDNVVYYHAIEGSWEDTIFPQFGFQGGGDGGSPEAGRTNDSSFGMGGDGSKATISSDEDD